jgi:hypothetical protein
MHSAGRNRPDGYCQSFAFSPQCSTIVCPRLMHREIATEINESGVRAIAVKAEDPIAAFIVWIPTNANIRRIRTLRPVVKFIDCGDAIREIKPYIRMNGFGNVISVWLVVSEDVVTKFGIVD